MLHFGGHVALPGEHYACSDILVMPDPDTPLQSSTAPAYTASSTARFETLILPSPSLVQFSDWITRITDSITDSLVKFRLD
jgi:hypothetical protein